MRLDHLLSKEEEVGVVLLSSCQGVMKRKHDDEATKRNREDSGDDALMGHTRSHPEHDG